MSDKASSYFIFMLLSLLLAVSTDLQEIKSAVKITDYITYKNGQDWSPAAEKALQDSDTLIFPAGRYYCSEINITGGKVIKGEGEMTIFFPLDEKLFNVEGHIEHEIPIREDIENFSNTILPEKCDNLSPGDDIIIMGQRNSLLMEGTEGINYNKDYVLGRTRKKCCYYGEFDIIDTIVGDKIITRHKRIYPDYFNNNKSEPENKFEGKIERTTSSLLKIKMVKNVKLLDFSITGTAYCAVPINILYGKNCIVDNVSFHTDTECYNKAGDKRSLSVIRVKLSVNILVKNCSSEFSQKLTGQISKIDKIYANYTVYNLFKMISCWYSGFKNCSTNCATHGFSITYNANTDISGVPSYKCFIDGCESSNNIWSGITTQQACYCTSLTNNKVSKSGQGVLSGGRNSVIKNNIVTTDLPFSTNYYYTHISFGGTAGIVLIEGYACGSIVENNFSDGYYSGILIRDGYEEKNIFEEGNIKILNNTVKNCVTGFSVKKNKYNKSINDISVVLERNKFNNN